MWTVSAVLYSIDGAATVDFRFSVGELEGFCDDWGATQADTCGDWGATRADICGDWGATQADICGDWGATPECIG